MCIATIGILAMLYLPTSHAIRDQKQQAMLNEIEARERIGYLGMPPSHAELDKVTKKLILGLRENQQLLTKTGQRLTILEKKAAALKARRQMPPVIDR